MIKKLLFILSLFCIVGFTIPTSEFTADTETVLLLHCNDLPDASTTFTDSETTPKTMTAGGDAQTDTSTYQFSPACGQFDGSTDVVTTPNSTDFNANGGAYTTELWARFNDVTTQKTHGLIGAQASGNGWVTFLDVYGGVATLYIQQDNANKWSYNTSSAINTWYHIAFTFDGTTTKGFIDGSAVGTDVTTVDWNNDSSALAVGALDQAGSGSLNGRLDEIRLSKGINRYSDVLRRILIISYGVDIGNLNRAGTPLWSCKIKVMCWWKNRRIT